MCNSYESRSVSAKAESYKKVRKQIKKKKFLPPHGFRDPGSGMGKYPDPGSGINIPDPQHWIMQKKKIKEERQKEKNEDGNKEVGKIKAKRCVRRKVAINISQGIVQCFGSGAG